MMGVTDIVKLKVDATTDTRQVIPQINALARAMTKSFYENMKSSLQKQFHQFLWVTLNDLWKMGSREVKDSVASAVGEILLSLGPFYGGGLMESLLAVINGEESCSTLLFASFAYLSRFFTGPEIQKFSRSVKLNKLFGPATEETLEILKKEVKSLPPSFLTFLGNRYIDLYEEDRSRIACLKALKYVVGVSADIYLEVIRGDLRLVVLGTSFSKNMPVLPEKLAGKLKERCVAAIKDAQTVVKEFEGACKFLRGLIMSGQASRRCVLGIFTKSNIEHAVSVRMVLTLPIEKEVAFAVYEQQASSVGDGHQVNLKQIIEVGDSDSGDFDSSSFGSVIVPRNSMPIGFNMPPIEASTFADEDAVELHARGKKLQTSETLSVPEVGSLPMQESLQAFPTIGSKLHDELPMMPVSSSHGNLTEFDGHAGRQKRKRRRQTNADFVRGLLSDFAPPTMVLPPITDRRCSDGISIDQYADFMSSAASIDATQISANYVASLMFYFSQYPEYQHELCNLILYCLRQNDDTLYKTALKVTAQVMTIIKKETLNCIIWQVVTTKNPPVARKMQILKLISVLKLDLLIKSVSVKLLKFVNESISPSTAKIKKCLRNAIVGVYHHSNLQFFQTFLNEIVFYLDVFHETEFEDKLSFLADVLTKLTSSAASCFQYITVMLGEAMTIVTFPRRVFTDIFRIYRVFAKNMSLKDLKPVIQNAMNILRCTYHEYVGESLGVKESGVFSHQLAKIDTLEKNADAAITNPEISHEKLWKCGKAALKFLGDIDWEKGQLKKGEITALVGISHKFARIYPCECILLMNSLISWGGVKDEDFQKFVAIALDVSNTQKATAALCELLVTGIARDIQYQGDITRLISELSSRMTFYRDLRYKEMVSIKLFCDAKSIGVTEDICRCILLPDEVHNWEKRLAPEDEDKEALAQEVDIDFFGEKEDEEDEDYLRLMPPAEGIGLYLPSFTPLVYANLDVAENLMTSAAIIAFTQYSSAKINQRQCNEMFRFAIENRPSRTVYYILRYAHQQKFEIDLGPYLTHPTIRSRKMFQQVFGILTEGKTHWLELEPEEMAYVEHFTGADMPEYVLNATGLDRRIAFNLVRFNPDFLIDRIMDMHDLSIQQLNNLCVYVQVMPKRDSELANVFRHLAEGLKDEPRKALIVQRMTTVYLSVRSVAEGKEFAVKYNEVLAGKLRGQPVSPAEEAEIVYAVKTISKYTKTKKISKHLCASARLMSPYGSLMSLNGSDLENPTVPDLLKSAMPSVRIQAIDFVVACMKRASTLLPPKEIIDTILNQPYVLTSTIEDSLYPFILALGSKETLPVKVVRDAFTRSYKYFFKAPCSQIRLMGVMNRLLPFLAKPEELSTVREFVESLIKGHTYFPSCAIDFMITFNRMTKNEDSHLFPDFLKYADGPLAVSAAESVTLATESAGYLRDTLYAVPKCGSFFAYFNAIVAIEKRYRDLEHPEIVQEYRGVHRIALEYLNNPRLRIFAPMFALSAQDVPIPEEVDRYISDTTEKISRVHSIDAHHEW